MKKQANDKILTTKKIEEEIKRVTYKSRYNKLIKNTVYSLITILAISILIATLFLPVLQINESSMDPTYKKGDIVVLIKTQNVTSGDVIAFYHGNKVLVKRVIATSGSFVNIDKSGNVYVDGELLKEDYVSEIYLGETDVEFPCQVENESYFVLSDNRNNINDSRYSEIGNVSKENVIGKIIFRVWSTKK